MANISGEHVAPSAAVNLRHQALLVVLLYCID